MMKISHVLACLVSTCAISFAVGATVNTDTINHADDTFNKFIENIDASLERHRQNLEVLKAAQVEHAVNEINLCDGKPYTVVSDAVYGVKGNRVESELGDEVYELITSNTTLVSCGEAE